MFSMTGFASYSQKIGNIDWDLKIATVNNKYLEINIEGIKDLYLQDLIKKEIKEQLNRGKIILQIRYKMNNNSCFLPKIDDEIFKNYLDEAARVVNKFSLTNDMKLSNIFRIKEIWKIEENNDVAEILDDEKVVKITREILKILKKNRENEGKKLQKQFKSYVKDLQKNAEILEKLKKDYENYLQQKIEKKLKEIEFVDENERKSVERDLNMILLKGDFEEEIVRIKSHLEHFEEVLSGKEEESVGKKMGFLVQELTREFNTLGDKINSVEGKKVAMESKLIIDRIREQALNVE